MYEGQYTVLGTVRRGHSGVTMSTNHHGSLKKSCQILNPFLNVFAPVMLTSLKQNCKVSSQHQNPRRFCFVEMNIEKKKFYLRYCARRPKILSTNLTDQVTRYASSQFPKGLHDDKSKKIPNMQKGM